MVALAAILSSIAVLSFAAGSSALALYTWIYLALSLSLGTWLFYPYYTGNDTTRDLIYAFNSIIKGKYDEKDIG